MGLRKDRVIPLWVRRGGTAETNRAGPEVIYSSTKYRVERYA
jgi:hypothetical protein